MVGSCRVNAMFVRDDFPELKIKFDDFVFEFKKDTIFWDFV